MPIAARAPLAAVVGVVEGGLCRLPSACSSLTAVLAPKPVHAGQVVGGVAAQRGEVEVLLGPDPVTIASRSGSSSGEASTPPLRMRSILVCSSISAKLSRSDVATTVRAPIVGACAATLASTSSASSPSGTTTTTPSSRSTSTARSSWRSRLSGLGARWAL